MFTLLFHIDHLGSVLCLQICVYPYFDESADKKQMTVWSNSSKFKEGTVLKLWVDWGTCVA